MAESHLRYDPDESQINPLFDAVVSATQQSVGVQLSQKDINIHVHHEEFAQLFNGNTLYHQQQQNEHQQYQQMQQ